MKLLVNKKFSEIIHTLKGWSAGGSADITLIKQWMAEGKLFPLNKQNAVATIMQAEAKALDIVTPLPPILSSVYINAGSEM